MKIVRNKTAKKLGELEVGDVFFSSGTTYLKCKCTLSSLGFPTSCIPAVNLENGQITYFGSADASVTLVPDATLNLGGV